MQMIPFKSLVGMVKLSDNGYWLYEASILSQAFPENGSIVRQVWAKNSGEARKMIGKIFAFGRWEIYVSLTKVHIQTDTWEQLRDEQRRQIKARN